MAGRRSLRVTQYQIIISLQNGAVCIKTNTVFSLVVTLNFSFLNNLKDLDPSYKTDLDLWDYLEMKNPLNS